MGIQISVQVLQYFWIAWKKKRCFSDYLIHPVADFDTDYRDLNIVDNKESLLYSIIVISMLGLGYEGSVPSKHERTAKQMATKTLLNMPN